MKRAKVHAKSAKIFCKERKVFFVKGAEVEVEDGTSTLRPFGKLSTGGAQCDKV